MTCIRQVCAFHHSVMGAAESNQADLVLVLGERHRVVGSKIANSAIKRWEMTPRWANMVWRFPLLVSELLI